MGLPRVLWGPILGPNHGMFSKHNGRGPLGSKGYPHTSFNSGKFPDTYTGFHIRVKYDSSWILGTKLSSYNISMTFKALEGTAKAGPQLALQLYITLKGLCLKSSEGLKWIYKKN